jgi:glycyl-tRNA synthetase beta chain
MGRTLLLEIGAEELPASFVASAVSALPGSIGERLVELRLGHGPIRAAGTPRRLAVWVEAVDERQSDVDEEVLGPPARVAFDADGKPTKAAIAFAGKIGCRVEDLGRTATDKGDYVAGRRRERGAPALDLLPAALERVCGSIHFRKSMRWSDVETAFGRPVRWLLGLFGDEIVRFSFAGVESAGASRGHRFLAPDPFPIARADDYLEALRSRHVIVDLDERRNTMVERLRAAAAGAGGELIEDEFLVGENLSLVETPEVVAGGFASDYLALPERVILDVAKGHQRYFGVRDRSGKLLPKYLAVVNTATKPENVRRGNDRVMRARLADAKFFHDTDVATPLAERRAALDAVVFQKRLGSIGDKVRRIERLVPLLGAELALSQPVIQTALAGAALAKCDLVTLMVGELPELQGEMGRAYALAQGVAPDVASVIAEHYQPRGADDATAPSDAGALVALADRLDTLAGCFAIGIVPTGAADPLALRRAAIGVVKTLLDKGWDLSLLRAIAAAHAGFERDRLDLGEADTVDKLGAFVRQRLRGVLTDELPGDAVDACLAAEGDRPEDVRRRARALAKLPPDVRAGAGEVFKRAANIAKDAPPGEPAAPDSVCAEVHPSEARLFTAFASLSDRVGGATRRSDYAAAFEAIAEFAPILGKYFDDVLVMAEDPKVRENRLRLMRSIQNTCSALAAFNLLAKVG